MTMNVTTIPTPSRATPYQFRGLLSGLQAGPTLSWGLLEVVALHRTQADEAHRPGFALAHEHLKLVEVESYGTVVLENTSARDPLIVPMHIGFFQPGAQNHATSRTLIIGAGERPTIRDCFCVQAAQGGLLQEHQQRFLMLPLSLRAEALRSQRQEEFSRLWSAIDEYTRYHGIVTGGHLERFLRPNFARLLPLRHALENVADQVGAAYFIGGRLAGVEVAPNTAYWQELAPILTMYCYGPAALLAERRGCERVAESLDLEALVDLDDLAARLRDVRIREAATRAEIVEEFACQQWGETREEDSHGLQLATLKSASWSGQLIRDAGKQLRYASVFRDVLQGLTSAQPPAESLAG